MGTLEPPLPDMSPPDLAADVGDTPPKAKKGVSAPAIHGGLTKGRNALMYDLGDAIPEVALDWFYGNLLPSLRHPLPQNSVDLVITELKRRGAITGTGVWAKFFTTPAKTSFLEDIVFKSFQDITAEIGEAAAAVLPSTQDVKQEVEFKCNPARTLGSTLRDNSSRPDSYGLYKKHPSFQHRQNSQRVYWEVVVAPGEFKKRDDEHARNDNVTKIMWSLNHLMREDVRRRFVVGYTIEDTNMRLWFGSRADVIVSRHFNFMTNHRALVHFVLSQMYATPEQLGYDTTIRYPTDVSLYGKQWDIDVRVWVPQEAEDSKGKGKGQVRKGKGRARKTKGKGKELSKDDGESQIDGVWVTQTYRTSKMLSNIAAETIRGRGTRVWEASRLDEVRGADGKLISYVPCSRKVVLKDSWIDSDRDREAVIMRQIVASAPDEEKATLKKHFLTVICYGDVFLGSPGNETPDTTSHMRASQVIPTDHYFKLVMETTSNVATGVRPPTGSGAPANPSEPKTTRIVNFDAKSHHRIVFGEVGATIDTLNSVRNILHMLAQATVALQSIHACGWIHRDISAGNILIVDGIAKITDLEYAKRMSDKSRHTLRTGTANYMALEADDHEYLFLPDPTATLENDAKKKASVAALYAAVESDQPEPDIAVVATVTAAQLQPPFYHNPIHDIESLWWLAVRLLLWRLIAAQYLLAQDVKWTLEKSKQQFNHYAAFFKDRDTRRNLYVKRKFSQGVNIVHPQLASIAGHLESVRVNLKTAYTTAEENIAAVDHTTGSAITTDLLAHLLTARHEYIKTDFLFEPIDVPARKDTPEEPAALPPATSTDSRLEVRKRLRDEPTLEAILSDSEDFGGSTRELVRDAKRMKLSNTEVGSPVAGPSTIPRAGHVEVEAPYSEEVVSGDVMSGKGQGKATEKGDEKAPARKRTRTRATPAGPLRRSTRLRTTTQH